MIFVISRIPGGICGDSNVMSGFCRKEQAAPSHVSRFGQMAPIEHFRQKRGPALVYIIYFSEVISGNIPKMTATALLYAKYLDMRAMTKRMPGMRDALSRNSSRVWAPTESQPPTQTALMPLERMSTGTVPIPFS